MSANNMIRDRRKALIEYKDKLLKQLNYYDARIEEISFTRSKPSYNEISDSSDSEPELPVDSGLPVAQLKLQQSSLKTCLQATQELTNLQVLQSEVTVLVDDPVIQGEPPVKEAGMWREVTAECRADLVPFSITFFQHRPEDRMLAPSYRCVRILAVRAPHAAELESSVINAVATPSDAVEVISNYAIAHRSRRTTVARLAKQYGDRLHMEPMPKGGCLLKCANLLEVSWTLQNKWSPIAPFHHRMKFDLEYMDESYVKIITQAHKQLLDPVLETDERTFLLSKIIATCLEAQGPTQDLYESMSSDPETAQSLRKRRTTLDQEPEQPIVKKDRDREVMAPPKSLPKKNKPKGKENSVENRKSKRVSEDIGKAKKAKVKAKSDKVKTVGRDNDNIVNNNENVDDEIGPKPKDVNDKNNYVPTKNSESTNGAEKKNAKEQTNVENAKKPTNENPNPDKNVVKKTNTNNTEKGKKITKVKKNPDNIISNKKDSNKANDLVKNNVAKIAEKDKQSNKLTAKNDNKENNKVNSNDKEPTAKPSQTIKNKIVKNNKLVNDNKEKVKTTTSKPENNENSNKIVKNKPKSATKPNTTDKNKVAKSVASANEVSSNVQQNTYNKKQEENAKSKPTNVRNDKMAKPGGSKTNKDIEVTIEKTVSKTAPNLKRNTNETDRDGKGDTNVAIPKKPKLSKPESTKNLINNKVNEENNVQQNTNNKKQEENAKSKLTNVRNDKMTKPGGSKTNKDIEVTIEKTVSKNAPNLKRNNNVTDRDGKGDTNVAIPKKPKLSKPESTKNLINNKVNEENKLITPQNVIPPGKIVKKTNLNEPKRSIGSIKNLKTGNIRGVFNGSNISKQSSEMTSKIPQKKLSSVSEATLKKNPLRISPRKIPSKFKTPGTVGSNAVAQKTTNIPRLMKKPSPKT